MIVSHLFYPMPVPLSEAKEYAKIHAVFLRGFCAPLLYIRAERGYIKDKAEGPGEFYDALGSFYMSEYNNAY